MEEALKDKLRPLLPPRVFVETSLACEYGDFLFLRFYVCFEEEEEGMRWIYHFPAKTAHFHISKELLSIFENMISNKDNNSFFDMEDLPNQPNHAPEMFLAFYAKHVNLYSQVIPNFLKIFRAHNIPAFINDNKLYIQSHNGLYIDY